jgi:hypothetical protein
VDLAVDPAVDPAAGPAVGLAMYSVVNLVLDPGVDLVILGHVISRRMERDSPADPCFTFPPVTKVIPFSSVYVDRPSVSSVFPLL